MEEKTYKFTIFLMKEDVQNYEECIDKEKKVSYMEFKELKGIEGVVVIADSTVKVPGWVYLLNQYTENDINIKNNISNKAVMLIRVKNRIMALTFGYGRSLLREESIERNFGLKSALNMLDSKKIRSIKTSTVEDMIIHTQKQSSYATEQEEFSLNEMSDIVTSITGKVKNDILGNYVSGKDSLSVSVKLFPLDLIDKLEYYLSAYESDEYKAEGFEWIDNVGEVRDKNVTRLLDNELVKKIKSKDITNIYASPPETIEWERIRGFMVTGMGKREDDFENYKEHIELSDYIENISLDIDLINKLKRDKVKVLYKDEQIDCISSIYQALVAQVKYNGELYILCNSCWYKINNDFYNTVKSFVSKIPISDIDLPNCNKNEKEGDYNLRVSEIDGYALMDKKLVGVEGGYRHIEACDIFTNKKQFVHVKNKSASAQLSHLFSQGKVSAECFIRDREYRKQVYNKIKKTLGRDIFNYRNKPDSDEYEVVYAIISDKPGNVEDVIPFFSMVNLMMSIRELETMHMRYSVKMVLKE